MAYGLHMDVDGGPLSDVWALSACGPLADANFAPDPPAPACQPQKALEAGA